MPEEIITCCLPVVLLPLVPVTVSLPNLFPLPPHLVVSSFHRDVDLVLHPLQSQPLQV